jgi:hypothetical protein
MNAAYTRFRTEINHFSLVLLINIVFAAIVMAYGVQYIVMAVAGNPAGPALPGIRIVTGAAALACSGLGIAWLLVTVRIFREVGSIRRDLRAGDGSITDDRLTCLIVRMLAHYRDNRKLIRTMILVCTLGGCAFFILGITTGISAVSLHPGGGAFTFDSVPVILSMFLTIGIALVSLLSGYYFGKFARVWDRRILEIDDAECALKESLGLDHP